MPVAAWKVVISRILNWLEPLGAASLLDAHGCARPLPRTTNFRRMPESRQSAAASQWFVDSRLLLDEAGMEFIYKTPNPHGTLPFPEKLEGRGATARWD